MKSMAEMDSAISNLKNLTKLWTKPCRVLFHSKGEGNDERNCIEKTKHKAIRCICVPLLGFVVFCGMFQRGE
jgi:hypothetical protein